MKTLDMYTDLESRGILDENRQELIEHGTVQFPVAVYLEDLLNDPIYWHWHKEWEFGIITEGEGIVAMDNKQYRLKAGDFFFNNAEVLHAAWASMTGTVTMHVIVFHPRIVGGSIESVFWQKYVTPLNDNPHVRGFVLQEGEKLREHCAKLVEEIWDKCSKKVPGYEFQVRNDLSELTYLVYQHSQNELEVIPKKENRDAKRIKNMMLYIQEHYGEDVSLAQLSSCADISESECMRCFKRVIGVTPIQFLKQFRIQQAKNLLANTSEKIVDIGIQCGFQDMSYFSKTFQQQCGCTPTEFRRKSLVEAL